MPVAIKYLLLVIAGFAIILCCSLFQHITILPGVEYHYSLFLGKNYRLVTAILFFLTGIVVGYYWRLNPFAAGICMISIIPLVIITEIIIYPNSHNLLGFEIVLYYIYSLPATAGVYTGKIILKQVRKSKHIG